jgi:uncharacterized protein YgbK (DUF1537 family)
VCRQLGGVGLEVLMEVEAGVPLARLVADPPLAVVTKAGGFGSPDTIVRAVGLLRETRV